MYNNDIMLPLELNLGTVFLLFQRFMQCFHLFKIKKVNQ